MAEEFEGTPSESQVFEERKRRIAHQMWEDEGQPEGQAQRHWNQACLVIMTLEDDMEIENPNWLRLRDTGTVQKSTIEVQAPAAEINYMPSKQATTTAPLSTLEEIKNRVLKRSAA